MREKIKVRKYHRPLNPTHLSVVCLVFEIITVHFLRLPHSLFNLGPQPYLITFSPRSTVVFTEEKRG